MRIKRRRLLFTLLTIIVLMGVFILLLPRLFQLPLVHEKINTFIEKEFPGTVTYRKETLTLFPTPSIHFYDVRLKENQKFSGTIAKVSATPHFFSLLRGRFNIAKLTLSDADCTAALPEQAKSLSPAVILAALQRNVESWTDMLGPVKQKKFILDIDGGTLTLVRADTPVFSLGDIDSRLHWHRPVISIDLTGKNELWDQSLLTLDVDIATRKISGRWTAENLTPLGQGGYTIPGTPIDMEEASFDADISWETENFETWRVGVTAKNPDLTFRNKGAQYNLRGKKAAGEIWIEKNGFHASIFDLDLDTPALRLTGGFDLDTQAPSVGWQLTVKKLDLATTREAALFFAGRFKTCQNICRVLQEGDITQTTMGQHAQTLKELKKVSTFHLQGLLENATVFVPKEDLLLEETSGEVTVSEGVLKAFEARTRLGNSTGSRGNFALALAGVKPRPWSLTCDIQADLAQLPPLLQRLTKNDALAGEMAGITFAEGSANGALVLDRGADSLEVTVDVSKFDLSADYHRIPFPVTLSGGGLSYRTGALRVEDVQGCIGASRFTDLTAGVNWETAPYLSISSARAEVDTNELASWLGGPLTACRNTDAGESGQGRLLVEHLQLDGPAASPAEWRFQSGGQVETPFTVCAPLFPEALTVYRGTFTATHEKIEVADADVSVLGARLSATGYLEGWMTQAPLILDARVEGGLNPDISDWICGRANIPELFKWRTPFELAPLTLHWHEAEGLRLSLEAAAGDGVRIALDMNKNDDVLAIEHLEIQDDTARAEAALTLDSSSFSARFSGALGHDTLSRLLAENHVLAGSLSGEFTARYELAPPYVDTMTGRLQADDLDLTTLDVPLKIARVSLVGNGTDTGIDAARFTWQTDEFSLSGSVASDEESLLLDLELGSGGLDWSTIKPLLDRTNAPGRPFNPFLRGEVRFACDSLSLTPDLSFTPLKTYLKLEKGQVDVEFKEAEICGISFPGTISLTADKTLFSFRPSANQQPLEPTVACLRKGKTLMDGSFDLSANLEFEWDRQMPLMEAIMGEASLTAKDGQIYKAVLLGKLFSLLNLSEILSGQFPDFEKEGFPYRASAFSGQFKEGRFELETGVIDGPAMKLFFEGTEDIINKEHELTVVVAPLKTVDAVVDKIPVISDVLEKGLVIYPVKVSGPWDEPQLTLLSPTAVGGEVLGIMLRTLRAPVTIFKKILPGDKTE